ncbi:MAG TPA: hypothetical protein DCE65_00165 [Clostridiales bacterium]|nr:hypothetical protein [Clostridiales bacterium]
MRSFRNFTADRPHLFSTIILYYDQSAIAIKNLSRFLHNISQNSPAKYFTSQKKRAIINATKEKTAGAVFGFHPTKNEGSSAIHGWRRTKKNLRNPSASATNIAEK